MQAAKESTASPAKGSAYIAEGSLKEGSSLITVYFTLRAAVAQRACSMESPRELQEVLILCPTSIDCDLIGLRIVWALELLKDPG